MIETEQAVAVVIVIGRGIVTETASTVVIVKEIGIMKLGEPSGDTRLIERMIMIMLNLNMRRNIMVKESVSMNLRMIVIGTTNLDMDISVQITMMILITMSIIVEGGSMVREMTMVIITINILIVRGWKMTTTLNGQHLNHGTGKEVVI